MRVLFRFFIMTIVCGAAGATAIAQTDQPVPVAAEQLMALANQSRAHVQAGALAWDPALAEAALRHCRRMVQEHAIAHRYGGELDVSERAAHEGAHFSLIEENVAVGPTATGIHEGWMNSPGHRTNLLNPQVDHVGIAVIASDGVLYAVADYTRAVAVRTPAQVEAAIGDLIHMSGLKIRNGAEDARMACTTDRGLPRNLRGGEPGFVMRWQGADLHHLPQALVDRLGSGRFHEAAVGSCEPHGTEDAFTAYRVAVLLY